MDTRERRWLTTLLVAMLLAPHASEATLAFERLPIGERARRSDVVVHGHVQDVTSFVEGDRLFTAIEVTVRETLKGDPGTETVAVRMYGGTWAGIRSRILGSPCFSEGEELVVFLGELRAGVYGLMNLAEGKFDVVRDGSGFASVRRDLTDTVYVKEATDTPPSTLEELRRTVRAAALEDEGAGVRR